MAQAVSTVTALMVKKKIMKLKGKDFNMIMGLEFMTQG